MVDFVIVDYSEYVVWVCMVIGAICLVWNIVLNQGFNAFTGGLMIAMGFLTLWRIRKFGRAHAVMDSVSVLKLENEDLHNKIKGLEDTKVLLDNKVKDMAKLMNIFDTNNKTAEEIQEDMIRTMNKLESENDRYESLNRVNAFMLADTNRDGLLDNQEKIILETITHSKVNSNEDSNRDGLLSRDEYLD